jgi:hypothetical protein
MLESKQAMFQVVIDKFKSVEDELKKKSWFKKGHWIVSVHGFPAKKPEFVTFHVFKKNWFNEEKQGIHIESFLAIDAKKRKKSSVTVHLLHEPIIPGTKVKRIELAKAVVESVRGEVESWEGYKFRAGAYGVQPFTKNLDGSSKDFEKDLVHEVERLCKVLGDKIDETLIDLIRSGKYA